MHLAGKLFNNAIANTKKADLDKIFTLACSELSEWLNNSDDRDKKIADYSDDIFSLGSNAKSATKIKERHFKVGTFYDNSIPANVPNVWRYLYVVLFQGIRMAGLLHDIGHLPYSHTVEDVINILWDEINQKNPDVCTENEREILKLMNPFVDAAKSKVKVHELIGHKLVHVVEKEVCKELKRLYGGNIQNEDANDRIFRLHSFEVAKRILRGNPRWGLDLSSGEQNHIYDIFHTIVSGMLDADRLDFVSRDLVSTSVSLDIVPYDRIAINLSFVKNTRTDVFGRSEFVLVTVPKTVGDVEDVLKKRWKIYKDIVHHHSVHKSELLMRNTLLKMARETLQRESPIVCFKEGFPALLSVTDFIMGIALVLMVITDSGHNDEIIKFFLQLDDAWLDTILKRTDDDKESKMLLELVTGREEYVSVIKRFDDFWDFDKEIFNAIFNDERALAAMKDAHLYFQYYKKQGNDDMCERIEPLLDFLYNGFDDDLDVVAYEYWRQNSYEHAVFCFTALVNTQRLVFDDSDWFHEIINDIELGLKAEIDSEDIMIGKTEMNDGIDNMTLGVQRNNGELWGFSDMSAIENILRYERNLIPALHLYCKKGSVDFALILKKIVTIICNNSLSDFREFLDVIKSVDSNLEQFLAEMAKEEENL